MSLSLQERFAPGNACFGCGQANPHGLQIRSMPLGDEVILDWHPQPRHEAIHGFVNGGVIATLFDCHMAWTAAWHLAGEDGTADIPLTVTAELSVSYLAPTPSTPPLQVRARTVEASPRKAVVEAELFSDGAVRATCRGIFVVAGDSMAG
jgi:acyl-coenzyme A thioesterase PaaI-like protein